MLLALFLLAAAATAQSPKRKVDALLEGATQAGIIQTAIGVTRKGTPIPALITAADLDYNTPKTRILLVAGLDGSSASVSSALSAIEWFHRDPAAAKYRDQIALSAVPLANPDGWALGLGPGNGSGGNPARGYAPRGGAYHSPTDPEAAYLWRWIGMHAPDLVIDIHRGDARGWGYMPPEWIDPSLPLPSLTAHLPPPAVTQSWADQLASQLVRGRPSGTGAVSALTFYTPQDDGSQFLEEILLALDKANIRQPSPARQTIQRRLGRTPLEVARQLASHYGHDASSIVYTRTVAILGRIRLAELTGDRDHLEDIERLLAPYASGEKPLLPAQVTTSHLAGHLVFSELARATGNQKYTELARAAADLGFDQQGRPRESMPFHHEMSDSVFMGTPILAETGRLTGERKYFDMAIRHWRFIQQLDQRPDGLYRNSPLNEAAWGRGNGFPALGLALSLTAIPEYHPGRAEMLAAYRVHMRALLRHQDPTGMWHQVIDHPESYRELTATAMIAVAMMRGLRRGWLERQKYEAAIDRAWYALKSRIAPSGELVDVCTGTGKQTSLRAYFDRTAILGRDPRGGAMALLVSVERAAWERDRK